MTNFTNHENAHDFVWRVKNESITTNMTNSGISNEHVHSYASQVNNALRSINEATEDMGAITSSRVHGFASGVDNALRSINSEAKEDFGNITSRVHGYASPVDNHIKNNTIGTISSSQVKSNAPKRISRDVEGFRLFSLAELEDATNNFSVENKLGGDLYRGRLGDGRDVVIKRKRFHIPASELAFLSRIHHKHLVRFVGFCEVRDEEEFLVYEYMKNGSVQDHLHGKNNVDKSSTFLNSSWKMRIKVALEAARGIEYLHDCADPSIIHGDINSSNILLDETWTTRVSDYGLSLTSPESEDEEGTVGYTDPDYDNVNELKEKSGDAYGLGVVLLELLTGRRNIIEGVTLLSVIDIQDFTKGERDVDEVGFLVDFAVPHIKGRTLEKVLDPRVEPPVKESEVKALYSMSHIAMRCAERKWEDRPVIADIVTNLKEAFDIY
ncbi:putative serine/threonine-protein kinase-like protein CCR3 [Abrus precatorius]|uniref:Serine/threonine-protein kinase-like protein CCR3 n=1 Tax=Abrus precatorius TaxID=3816 RepID=A0A8B8K1M6_ABRPR|nr:putative serine/threonine-protein kinase-like protein CCR3 [Abrus precatorius]